jgi:DNA-binding NtrC family response regulator
MLSSVLIVDDEKHTREGLRQALEEDYDVSVAASAEEAFNQLESQEFDVVLTDLRMPGKSGLKVIDKALALPQRPAVLMMTAYGNIDTAVEAMRRGAWHFVTKPVNIEELDLLIRRALRSRNLEQENTSLQRQIDDQAADRRVDWVMRFIELLVGVLVFVITVGICGFVWQQPFTLADGWATLKNVFWALMARWS